MKKKIIFFIFIILIVLFLILLFCLPPSPPHHKVSYHTIHFDTCCLKVTDPTGTSSLSEVAVVKKSFGTIKKLWKRAWWITKGGENNGIEIDFKASTATMVQVAVTAASVGSSNSIDSKPVLLAKLNGEVLKKQKITVKTNKFDHYVFQLPLDDVRAESNELVIYKEKEPGTAAIKSIQLMPRNLYSHNGILSTTLYAQFGRTNHVSLEKGKNKEIWTRAYGLEKSTEMIPGPTLFYKAGDLLQVNLVNKLNNVEHGKITALGEFEKDEANNLSLNSDETLANLSDKIRQEVNIPHNLNNTNLHVHGLHVDPEKDDVTIVIVPDSEKKTTGEYDAPDEVPKTPEDLMCKLDEGAVSDQAVKPGEWFYEYRLPKDHLPGTHWFHPHKHGSTAAQVENGMAGSMVILEPDNQAVFPESAFKDGEREKWLQRYDRVMMIQQIANYGLQQGKGGQQQNTGQVQDPKKTPRNKAAPDTVINGEHQPVFTLPQGQIVRWRFVNAGANHQAFNHMWLGADTGLKDDAGNKIYLSQSMYAVAFDGITISKLVEITADSPLLLAPGNRADILFQVPSEKSKPDNDKIPLFEKYTLFKYYPTNISVVDKSFYTNRKEGSKVSDYLRWDCSVTPCKYAENDKIPIAKLIPAFQQASNPYLFYPNNQNFIDSKEGQYSENFAGFRQHWRGESNDTKEKGGTDIVPLIKLKEGPMKNGGVALDFALTKDFPNPTDCNGGKCNKGEGNWVPPLDTFGGGKVTPEKLLTINVVKGDKIGPEKLPKNKHLNKIAVTGKFAGKVPDYVASFGQGYGKVLQSRPVIFDKSGVAIRVGPKGKEGKDKSIRVNQFTLNGRPFALNDMIGNSTIRVNDLVSEPISIHDLKSVDTQNSHSKSAPPSHQCHKIDSSSCLDIKEELSFESSGTQGIWSNGVCRSGDCPNGDQNKLDYYWVNPGYFQPLKYDENNDEFLFASDESNIPTWKTISGLETTSIKNDGFKPDEWQKKIIGPNAEPQGNVNGVPGLPVATTGEEWIFINNSDIGHPFHIHINPFFVMEVGQLSYEQFTYKDETVEPHKIITKSEWVMRAHSMDKKLEPCHNKNKPPKEATVCAGESATPYFVGNWWDTVIVPPHGYVRMRYWINVPDQTGAGEKAVVKDNDNKIGIWVYHCHILRHEDRGMMMPVITQQLTGQKPPDGPYQCPIGMTQRSGNAHAGH